MHTHKKKGRQMATLAPNQNSGFQASQEIRSDAKTASTMPSQQVSGHQKVKVNEMPWFHGKIAREKAEELLNAPNSPDGVFLVRESYNFPGDYTLCVCFQGKVEHYRVIAKKNTLTIDEEEKFENLTSLVCHYMQDADGLCTKLTEPKRNSDSKVAYHDVNFRAFKDAGWEIKLEDLQILEKLGKGEFGDVMLGIYKEKKVAIKTMTDEQTRRMHQFLAEATVMTSLQHENLVCLLGIVLDQHLKHMKIVTEYMEKGSLLDYLRSRGRQGVTKEDQINFTFDTCKGMEYLESQNVIHRDLAARNVLISKNKVAKVSDFGLALHTYTFLESGKLPIKWTAPEALRKQNFSSKSDMWSFGVLLWEIYSYGRVPYPRLPLAEVVKQVEEGFRMEAPDGCPADMYEIMRQAWELDPTKRPSFSNVRTTLERFKSTMDFE